MVVPHIKRGGHEMVRRAQAGSSFFVPDSSPMFTYSTDDWSTGYAAQPNGYDQTLHLSSSSGSRVSFNLAATSLTILVPAFQNCTSIISINSSNPVPACATRSSETQSDIPFSLYSLPLGTHSVIWDVGNMPADTEVVFWGIDGSRPEVTGSTNVTIDNTFSRSSDGQVKLEYAGSWEDVKEGVQTDLAEKDSLNEYYNKTLAVTKQRGASVAFTGAGSAVYLYGNVGPDYGSATLSLNEEVVESSINLTSPWPMQYELLWFRTGLDPTAQTEVLMTNLADSKMSVDFVLFTASPETIAKINPGPAGPESFTDSLAGKIVLFFLLPFIVFTLAAVFVFFYIRRRRAQRVALAEAHQRQYSQSSSADFKFPNSDASHWSEEPKSSRYSTVSEPSEADLVFVSYAEAKGQRMSEHWNKSASSPPGDWNHEEEIASPRSGRSGMSRSPPMELRSLSQSIRNSTLLNPSILEERSGASGSEQYHGGDENSSDTQSNWGTPFAPSTTSRYPNSVFPSSRRETTGTLPAYTLDDDQTPPASAIRTTPGSTFDSAAAEKLQLQLAYTGGTTPRSETASPTSPVAGPSRPPTQAEKRSTYKTHKSGSNSITSVFGAPPSEWRQSIPQTPHPPPQISLPLPRPPSRFTLTRKPVPGGGGGPVSPTIAELPYDGSPNSTKVQPKTSISPEDQLAKASIPPSSFQDLQPDRDSDGKHNRNKSLGGISAKTVASAARPDSDVIPFQAFQDFVDENGLARTDPDGNDIFGTR